MLRFWASLGLGFFCFWLPTSAVQAQLEVPPPSDLPVAILPKAPEDLKKPKAVPNASATPTSPRPTGQRPQTAIQLKKTKQDLVQTKRKQPKTSRPLTLAKGDQASRGKLSSRLKNPKRATTMTQKANRIPRP